MCDWRRVSESLPPDGTEVETKVDDEKGCRNVQTLIHHDHLWWIPDNRMYVYYVPTHWREIK
jgi:hypothetical protein